MENETNLSDMPGCSYSNTISQGDELQELSLAQGINVWSANQELLEEQALKELEIFSNHNKSNLEDGEIESDAEVSDKKQKGVELDINSYIKQQEELKKRKEYYKTLQPNNDSDNKADAVNKRSNRGKKKIEVLDNNNVNINSHIQQDYENGEENSGSEYFPSENDSDFECNSAIPKKSDSITKRKKCIKQTVEKVRDDGLLSLYKQRLEIYYKNLEEENKLKAINNASTEDFKQLKGGLKVPKILWDRLYSYQQDGIKWLWTLHQKQTGGLLGDEMGLGKTVQIISFLQAVEFSKTVSVGRFVGVGPSIIVCPATVIHQWVQHFHEWAPEFRVAVLHQSGTYQGNKAKLIKDINKNQGILLTTYLGILKFKGNLIEHTWHYLILDEGHKIRNPTAKISVACKEIRTPYRLMLTGSPMQNNLTELWSLFDFTNPGMLGNLNIFTEHFANPILQGGFTNASPMQEATALSVASTLKNIITPYLLRRTKTEVQDNIMLPNKSEQVLFCSLTQEQKNIYKDYLMSEHVNSILGRGTKNWFANQYLRGSVLVAITALRKICNHPDIILYDTDEIQDTEDTPIEHRFGYYKKSGKMVVVSALLKIWKKQKHRVLLFTQSRTMIRVFQEFLEQQGYKYLKMDGSTSISSRQPLIDKFNKNESYDVFLLTTRVGGLGINLTGADRVIIYDPDWNPATDTQARERAWRIGQEKQVTIYRLLSAGTIEEKMYQRQVWKQLLSNKVLLDPKTHRLFKSSDLHDLFSLQESPDANPETANIFHDSRVKIQENLNKKGKKRKLKTVSNEEPQFTEDKIQAMKNLAQQIAKSLTQEKKEVKKTSYQIELETEREVKLKEKQELKKLTPMELIVYNRKKAEQKDDDTINKIDGCDTNVSFSKALEYSEHTSKLYHDLNSGKLKVDDITEETLNIPKNERKKRTREPSPENNHKRKKHKKSSERDKVAVDTSRTIDGEEVEGLVKTEMKKKKKEKATKNNSQDNFVLEKLFSKKGVSGALEHDSIVDGGRKPKTLKMRTEAQFKANKSLEALRKSRIDNWKW